MKNLYDTFLTKLEARHGENELTFEKRPLVAELTLKT